MLLWRWSLFWAYVLLFCTFLCDNSCFGWRRRRRRRAPPPPPQDCVVSGWSSWSECTEKCRIGTHTRTRSVVTAPRYGGAGCPPLQEDPHPPCGEHNGGCSDHCSDGVCSCYSGYELAADQKACQDQDECTDGTHACIFANCVNTQGGYTCQCLPGYKPSSNTVCVPKLCSPLTAPQCPVGAYQDVFGPACLPVEVKYPDGYEFLEKAQLTCRSNYQLALISQPSSGKKFAEDFSTVDYATPPDRTTCIWDSTTQTVTWDWNAQTNPYYCRRVNDPPSDVVLSQLSVNEKVGVLTEVGQFIASDPQNNQLTFTITNVEGHQDFLIHGDKLLVKSITIWSPQGGNTRMVNINVTDNGRPAMYTSTMFNITIVNINDPPRDLELSNHQVSEHIPRQGVVGNLTAIDDDIGTERSANFDWELVDSDNGFFALIGSQIVVAKSLDHGLQDLHRITVRCSDFDTPKQTSGSVHFTIAVQNENDFPKTVVLSGQSVPENSRLGTVVGVLQASDDDNQKLMFTLNGSDAHVLQKFQLSGPTNCTLTQPGGKVHQICSIDLVVAGDLNYEDRDEYDLWVAVSDAAGTTRKKFTIRVDDVNEVPIAVILTPDHVIENSPPGTVVGEFLVTDPDDKNGPRQTHICSLLNTASGDEDSFVIVKRNDRNLLQVKAGRTLDYETKDVYNITVQCNDNGGLGLTRSFVITVTNVNESPTSLSLSNTAINENQAGVSLVGVLSATDPEGDGQTFMYTVLNASAGHFVIAGLPTKNELRVNGPLNHESTPTVLVRVRVADTGGLHLDKSFTITINDVNDAPTDISLTGNPSIDENSARLVYIGSVAVSDEDLGAHFSCRLLNSSKDRVMLKDLTLLVGPTNTDYETLDSLKSLTVSLECSDQHGASIIKSLTIPVRDVNERPTKLLLTNLDVVENQKDAGVGILKILDPDLHQRHNCTVVTSLGDVLFYVGSIIPPVLRTAKALDFETSRRHAVTVKCQDIVKDHSQKSYVIQQLFIIDVIDLNERPFIRCDTNYVVSPSSSVGSVIGKLQGFDADNAHYYRTNKIDVRKQLLTYHIENESLPIDISSEGLIYLEKPLRKGEYNGSLVVAVTVEDDGTILQHINESLKITKSAPRRSTHDCTITISSNLTYTDIHLSSNEIYENATNGTVIGRLSRNKTRSDDVITYSIIQHLGPFGIVGDLLVLAFHNVLDYENLPAGANYMEVNVSSHSKISGIYTKKFWIKILDVNEAPEVMCLLPALAFDDCTVLGHILIEDPDHPNLKCDDPTLPKIAEVENELSLYRCVVDEGEDVLSNEVNQGKFSVVEKLSLKVKNSLLTPESNVYNVTVICRHDLHPAHQLTTMFNVEVKVSTKPTCRNKDLCSSCPEPVFCLSHILANGRCVDEEYRINSSVAIPGDYFAKTGFSLTFELYIKSLIELTSNGKTLAELLKEFDEEYNDSSGQRRRRRNAASYSDVYVELLATDQKATQTSVLFAVAETKQNFKLIPASEACKLLADTEVRCIFDNTPDPNAGQSTDESGSSFPFWVIYIVIALVVIMVVIVLFVVYRNKMVEKRSDTSVHYARDGNRANIRGSVYDTPDIPDELHDNQGYEVSSFQGDRGPILVDVRRDIKVFDNPTYRPARNPDGGHHSEGGRTMNQYEEAADPVYQTIDDEFYERVDEESRQSSKKSRSNPVYNMNVGEEDTLNPVVNLSVRKTSGSEKVNQAYLDSDHSDTDDSVLDGDPEGLRGGVSTFMKDVSRSPEKVSQLKYDSDTDDSVMEGDPEGLNTTTSTFAPNVSSNSESSPHRGAVGMANPIYETDPRESSEKSTTDGGKSFPPNNNDMAYERSPYDVDMMSHDVNNDFQSSC